MDRRLRTALCLEAGSARADLPAGFTRIFDGKTTKGWHFSGTVHHGTTGIATVTKDGILQLTQHPFGQGGLFITDKTYKNIDLYIEVKIPFASNSGIFLRSTEGASAYQVELVQGGATGQLLGENLRLSQGIPAPDLTTIWKTDEFNSIQVRMEGDAPHVTIWIDGVKTGEVQEPRNDQIGGVVGGSEWHTGLFNSRLMALDYRTGQVRWQQNCPQTAGFWSSTHPGVLTTAGGLVFSGDPSGNFIAFDAATGKTLWHASLSTLLTNSPQTYALDGRQYVVVAAGDSLFGFALQ